MPKVSVIMPCYNHAKFLAESVKAVLDQSFTDLELIIIDDCSTDHSWDVICKLADSDSRILPLRHSTNNGLSKARNNGLRASKGEFIAFCDSDDVWTPNKLDVQVSLLDCHPEYALTYCDSLIIDENSRSLDTHFSDLYPLPEKPSGFLFLELIRRNFINIQSVLVRKEFLDQIGGFDEQVDLVQDWWCWLRLSRSQRFLYSWDALAKYRVHSRSTNIVQKREYSINRVRVYHRVLREYPDLQRSERSSILYDIGCDLDVLGKSRTANKIFWRSIGVASTDWRAFGILIKAGARMVMGTV
ncbi:MAG: glycosyltransferase family 2 protein [Limisphaerales bacterium]